MYPYVLKHVQQAYNLGTVSSQGSSERKNTWMVSSPVTGKKTVCYPELPLEVVWKLGTPKNRSSWKPANSVFSWSHIIIFPNQDMPFLGQNSDTWNINLWKPMKTYENLWNTGPSPLPNLLGSPPRPFGWQTAAGCPGTVWDDLHDGNIVLEISGKIWEIMVNNCQYGEIW